MHVLLMNFRVEGLDEASMQATSEEYAPYFAAIPGLISKVWLKQPGTNTYGGVYTFESREALDGYKASDLFLAVADNPNFRNVSALEFEANERLSRMTRGYVTQAAKAA